MKNLRTVKDLKIKRLQSLYQSLNRSVAKKDIKLPEQLLAFELLSNANISKQDKMLVLSGRDFSQKLTLFEQAKRSLRKFKRRASRRKWRYCWSWSSNKTRASFSN